MITVKELQTRKPEEITVELAYAVAALTATARRAIEAEGSDVNCNGDAIVTLKIAEELSNLLIDGSEFSRRKLGNMAALEDVVKAA